mmetsp:Transcript_38914/g.76708  ORF Transcript_38914/g.76708 Transcript_38914/m.76708 type:complete len:481 (-) Transcript_38914:43-1485(-)
MSTVPGKSVRVKRKKVPPTAPLVPRSVNMVLEAHPRDLVYFIRYQPAKRVSVLDVGEYVGWNSDNEMYRINKAAESKWRGENAWFEVERRDIVGIVAPKDNNILTTTSSIYRMGGGACGGSGGGGGGSDGGILDQDGAFSWVEDAIFQLFPSPNSTPAIAATSTTVAVNVEAFSAFDALLQPRGLSLSAHQELATGMVFQLYPLLSPATPTAATSDISAAAAATTTATAVVLLPPTESGSPTPHVSTHQDAAAATPAIEVALENVFSHLLPLRSTVLCSNHLDEDAFEAFNVLAGKWGLALKVTGGPCEWCGGDHGGERSKELLCGLSMYINGKPTRSRNTVIEMVFAATHGEEEKKGLVMFALEQLGWRTVTTLTVNKMKKRARFAVKLLNTVAGSKRELGEGALSPVVLTSARHASRIAGGSLSLGKEVAKALEGLLGQDQEVFSPMGPPSLASSWGTPASGRIGQPWRTQERMPFVA